VRVTILGAGAGIAQAHLRALQAVEAQVVAVQDIDAQRVETVAEQTGAQPFTSLKDALAVPSDMAVVVAPHPFHAPLVIAALEAGKHVLVEKPMSDSVGEADRMIEASRRAGRLLGVALQHRTRDEVRVARDVIQSGGLGLLQRADLIGNWPRKRGYFEVSPWRGTWRGEGGGVTINQGQHDLDLLTYLAGPPQRVFAWTRTRIHHIQTEDTAAALLEWSDGAIGSIHLSTIEVDESQRLELTGTGGRLRLLHGRLDVVENEVDFREFVETGGNAYAAPPTREPRSVEAAGFDHAEIYRNFLNAVAGKESLVAPAESALATLELANAMLYSSAIDAPVRLPLDRAAYAAFLAERRERSA
jgi:predicted dehydrogenase